MRLLGAAEVLGLQEGGIPGGRGHTWRTSWIAIAAFSITFLASLSAVAGSGQAMYSLQLLGTVAGQLWK